MTETPPDPGDGSDLGSTPTTPRPGDERAKPGEERHAERGVERGDSGLGDGSEGGGNEEEDEDGDEGDEEGEDDDDDEEDGGDDEEPKLKYARLTQHLGPVYRNGDAMSSFMVAGDKMIVGTHKGNIHIIQLPLFQTLRSYHAHSASVTSVSISPNPPPIPKLRPDAAARVVSQANNGPLRPPSRASGSSRSPSAAAGKGPRDKNQRDAPLVPSTPSNNLHVGTSSMDGNVCVQSLLDPKDVSLRNFARPVQAVALSPDYKNDATYLSGGLAGQLILTVGAPPGRSTSTTTGTAAATASSWLGSVGIGSNMGKDTVLHAGEGTVSAISWSLSGKYAAFANEHGVWIWRTSLHLDAAESDDAWTRVEHGHVDRPQTPEWDTMARVWKARLEWIDEAAVEPDDLDDQREPSQSSPALGRLKQQHLQSNKRNERLLIGWGAIIWLVNVKPGGIGVGRNVGEKSRSSAEVVRKLRMDCIISGVSLYTQNLLLVLGHCTSDDDEDDDNDERGRGAVPTGGIRRRQNNQRPELRLIDLASETETTMESLTMSRFETLGSGDYHLGVVPAQDVASSVVATRGALEALAGFGNDVWNAAINPLSLFGGSGASIRSGKDSNDGASSSRAASTPTLRNTPAVGRSGTLSLSGSGTGSVHPNLLQPGIKIFVHSPYDCILATKRDLADHYLWLLERQQYQQAWELVDQHPEIASSATSAEKQLQQETPGTPQGSDDFYEETASVADGIRTFYSAAEKEKRRVGELWVQELVEAGHWARAGQVCGQVLGSPDRWEKWVWTFAGANRFDEIANYIPPRPMHPPIPRTIYEVVLGHYIQTDKPRFRDLLDRWSLELFDLATVSTALENQIRYGEVRPDHVDGEGSVDDSAHASPGRDWRIVMESLARLHEANGRQREALKCYIKLQDADSAMRLIKQSHLADAVADDIPGFLALRVPLGRADTMALPELESATREAVTLLVDEAQHGLVRPAVVVSQLSERHLDLYIFFYLRALWRGHGIREHGPQFRDRLVSDSKSLVDDFADLAVRLFAVYDRPLLMEFLKTSTAYAFESATQECESLNYIPELVYLYSKTGQMKRALYLIIDRLGDVSQAIAFAKDQEDPDLWGDLLDYSMDKPRFIRGLLEEVGTAINPITLVRRIPEGLEVPGLREGLKHIMKEHEIQYSISLGVARVLRSEVATAQATLRRGQRRAVKFEVVARSDSDDKRDAAAAPVPAAVQDRNGTAAAAAAPARGNGDKGDNQNSNNEETAGARRRQRPLDIGGPPQTPPQSPPTPGHCARCHEAFAEWEPETLVGFACGHVFHLAHLLELLYPDDDAAADVVSLGGGGGSEDSPSRGYHVGPKVTRARLLRDRIRGGCPVCM